jgi:hypothetical protein
MFLQRRLTLAELDLTDDQKASLRTLSKHQRQALLDACQHIIYTTQTDAGRKCAQRLKGHFRKLSLAEDNALPSDAVHNGKKKLQSYMPKL